MGINFVVEAIFLYIPFFGAGMGIGGIDPPRLFGDELSKSAFLVLVVLVILVTIGADRWLSRSWIGLGWAAIREDEQAAGAMGIDVVRFKVLAFTAGSVGAEWVEGTASSYGIQAGSSTFRSRRHPDVPWTIPGSDLCSVILGQGGTTWRSADAFPPDSQGWQRVAIEPGIVAGHEAAAAQRVAVHDDAIERGMVLAVDHDQRRAVHGGVAGAVAREQIWMRPQVAHVPRGLTASAN